MDMILHVRTYLVIFCFTIDFLYVCASWVDTIHLPDVVPYFWCFRCVWWKMSAFVQKIILPFNHVAMDVG